MKLPIPTGVEFKFEESPNSYLAAKNFIIKYRHLLNISRIMEGEGIDALPSATELDVSLKTHMEAEDILLLGEFLKEIESIKIPAKRYYEKFIEELNNDGLVDDIFTPAYIPSLFEGLLKIVNDHNLYFDSISTYKLSKITNNSTMNGMYNVSKDPVNLIQAHTSVDATTGPLKDVADLSKRAAKSKYRCAGNVANKFESINENQVGGKGIGICATGLKSYFGLTQYCNYVLNNGTEEDLERLLIGTDHKGIEIGGKTYYTLANIRAKDINTIKNSELFAKLSEITQDEDIALTLSALLSLATDNAKELALDKLNAGTKMLGMYIYGLCIGMLFDDIARILMSDVGDVFRNLLDDDKFSRRDAFSTIDEKLFKYFTKGPYRLLLKYNLRLDQDITLFDLFKKELANKFGLKSKAVHQLLMDISTSNMPLSAKLYRIEELRSSYNTLIGGYKLIPETKELYNQLLDFIEDYICQADVIYKNQNTFKDIIKLAAGAKELKTLGQVLGLNLGIKTKPDEFITLINNLRLAIYNKTNNLEDIVDLTKFVFDENPYEIDEVTYPTYKDYVIAKYETVKDSFNIFDVVSKVPHYMGYLKTLVTDNIEISNAFTFRSSNNLFIPLKEKINTNNLERLLKGIQNFCGDWLLKHWMLDRNKTIIVPAGNMAFDKQGKIYPLTEDKVLHLGLDEDNATFRLWMESKVIPDLLKGILRPGKPWVKISRNKFIKDLGYNMVNKTISGNNTVIRALPINMMPTTDNERNLFDLYKSLFNELTDGYQYELYRSVIDSNGQIKSETYLSLPIPITDLITYYAMIANEWKLSQSSLVPITEDFLNMGIIKEFHDYISNIDKSGFTLSMNTIIFDEILPYIAPKESSISSFANYIFEKDRNTKIRSLKLRFVSKHSSYYSKLSNQVDSSTLNFFSAGRILSGKGLIDLKVSGKDVKIIYDLIDGTYDSISGLDSNQIEELSKIPEFEKIPLIKVNGAKIPNILLLQQALENIINKCGK